MYDIIIQSCFQIWMNNQKFLFSLLICNCQNINFLVFCTHHYVTVFAIYSSIDVVNHYDCQFVQFNLINSKIAKTILTVVYKGIRDGVTSEARASPPLASGQLQLSPYYKLEVSAFVPSRRKRAITLFIIQRLRACYNKLIYSNI